MVSYFIWLIKLVRFLLEKMPKNGQNWAKIDVFRRFGISVSWPKYSAEIFRSISPKFRPKFRFRSYTTIVILNFWNFQIVFCCKLRELVYDTAWNFVYLRIINWTGFSSTLTFIVAFVVKRCHCISYYLLFNSFCSQYEPN